MNVYSTERTIVLIATFLAYERFKLSLFQLLCINTNSLENLKLIF